MKLYKSNEPNTFHYVTLVTYNRAQVFRADEACEVFVDTLRETREKFPYKLLGYVLMPDHVHAIVNNRSGDISDWLRRVGGNSESELETDNTIV
jgi:REP element-mobilizing transposase RayT